MAVIVTGSRYMLGFGEKLPEVIVEAPSESPIVSGNRIKASNGIRKGLTRPGHRLPGKGSLQPCSWRRYIAGAAAFDPRPC